jgi:hypothetical protein
MRSVSITPQTPRMAFARHAADIITRRYSEPTHIPQLLLLAVELEQNVTITGTNKLTPFGTVQWRVVSDSPKLPARYQNSARWLTVQFSPVS